MELNARREQTLADYLAIVRRHKWMIVAITIVVPLAAYLISVQQPKVFRATSDVLLNRQDLGSALTGIPTSNTFIDADRHARTHAALARVPEVALATVRRAKVEGMTPAELLASSDVKPRADTDLLTFSVRSGDGAIAARLATAYAQAFAAYKLAMDTTSLSRARAEIENRLSQLRRAGDTESAAYRQLVQKSQDLRTLELLQVPASVVREPTGAVRIAPTPTRNATLGMLLGLMVGLGAAFVLNGLDRRIRNAEEVEHELRTPLLARLPAPPRGRDRLTILDGPPELAEALSRLRANFDFANRELNAKLVMVTSAGAREGKSTTVSNLGIALARTGRHVTLVDLDLRRPALGRVFHLADRRGLTDAATGGVELEAVLNPIIHAPTRSWPPALHETQAGAGVLEVVTAGETRVDPADFVESPRLADILQRLSNRCDIVLIDSPPILAAGDAMALTAKVDTILLINKLGTLTRASLSDLKRALDTSPAPTLGFVATGAPVEDSYYTYRAEGRPATDIAKPRKQAVQRWMSEETPAASEAGAPAGRWARPSSGR